MSPTTLHIHPASFYHYSSDIFLGPRGIYSSHSKTEALLIYAQSFPSTSNTISRLPDAAARLSTPGFLEHHKDQATWSADDFRDLLPTRDAAPSTYDASHLANCLRVLLQAHPLEPYTMSSEAWTQQSLVTRDELDPQELQDLVLALSLSECEASTPDRGLFRTTRPETRAARGLINFKKTWMYANSRLPPFMPPLTIYMPTWRLLCLAAQASLTVYEQPRGDEREHFVKADWQQSTKAMVMKTRPLDDQNVIVFAIRGSQMNLADWSVNFRPEPVSPSGFLDDAGNACHAGFLTVAKAMIQPVAARLRQLLEQDPSRTSSSLLITGHSAGGAVAALLYAHMLSERVESELRDLACCFQRVHCIVFGTPPLTLLPLQKPSSPMSKKSMFMSFMNEGDPVVRAEKAYVRSLARVLAASTPALPKQSSLKKVKSRFLRSDAAAQPAPYWPVPSATLSSPGRLIIMRIKPGHDSTIEAVNTTDEQLRSMLFGDPAMHAMTLYKQRVDRLAVEAVTGGPLA